VSDIKPTTPRNGSKKGAAASTPRATLENIDMHFSKVDNLQFLSRFIFAMLKNPVRYCI
jgi:hypothetical protein